MKELEVRTASSAYPVYIGEGIRKQASRPFVFTEQAADKDPSHHRC